MFQIKNFVSIVAAQINHARGVTTKITDFQPGSVARTIMEAPAIEVEELYMQMFLGLRDAIPVATFQSFGFERLPAARALGYVSVSVSTPIPENINISLGTLFSTIDGRTYSSTAAVTWLAGSSLIRIPVQCSVVGVVGNAAEGTITSSPFFNSNYTISNSDISSGRDVESDSEREARFAEFVGSLSRGTVAACLYGVSQARVTDSDGNTFEYVIKRGIYEQPGYVTIYLYSNQGVPSSELIQNAQNIIDGTRNEITGEYTAGFRAAGIRVVVQGMSERLFPLSIKVKMLDGFELDTGVYQQLSDIFASTVRTIEPGTTLYLGTMIDTLLAADGVQTIVPVTNSNIVCDVDEVLTPGTLTVTAL